MDLADISHFFGDNMMFSWFDLKIENQVWGSRRAREAERRPAGPRARQNPHTWFSNFKSKHENIMLLHKKVRGTQPNPRYSAKNNDAMRLIASFMPIY